MGDLSLQPTAGGQLPLNQVPDKQGGSSEIGTMMFADAYDQVKNFTRPVVVSNRMWDGTVSCAIAAFVVLNEDGWFATAAHILGPWFAWRQHQEHIARHLEQGGTPNPKWITNHSFWWGRDGLNLAEVHVRNESDLALGRLEPFLPGIVSQ